MKKTDHYKDDGGQNRKPLVKRPKTLAAANGATNYRRAKPCTTSQSKSEHEFGKFRDRVEGRETNKALIL
jgi:hypothetical protein